MGGKKVQNKSSTWLHLKRLKKKKKRWYGIKSVWRGGEAARRRGGVNTEHVKVREAVVEASVE